MCDACDFSKATVIDKTHDLRIHSNGLVECRQCVACPCHKSQQLSEPCPNPGEGD